MSSIIYKKRKNTHKQKYLINNEKCVVLPSYNIPSQEYKKFINPICYNYEELHVFMEINTGSVNEQKNQQGISHLCEHVSYMGSKKRKSIIDKNVRTNAYTDFHHIVFYISISLNKEIYKENAFYTMDENKLIEQLCRFNQITDINKLKLLNDEELINFDIYSLEEFNYKHKMLAYCIDTMVEVLEGKTQFTKERIQKEKKAIFSEYSIINTVDYKMNSDIIKTLHNENRLSHRLPIGKLELLKRYEEKDLKKYFNLFFRTENANLYIYGDINIEIAKQIVKEKFEKVKKQKPVGNDLAFLSILNTGTLRAINKNLPAVYHNFVQDSTEEEINRNVEKEEKDGNQNRDVKKEHKDIYVKTIEKIDDDIFIKEPDLDDNIIDVLKLKQLKTEDSAKSEENFQKYLRTKYAVNLEEEKSLNKIKMNTVKTAFEVFPYSLNNININILMKEPIKGIRTEEDYKTSIIKEIIFSCLSFRFNVHRHDLFNNIDINEYTNINEGATIRTIEIKTTEKSFEKTIKAFYQFLKSVLVYGFSYDELKNYELNEVDLDGKEEQKEETKKGQQQVKQKNEMTEENENKNEKEKENQEANVSATSTISKNMKLVHPDNIEDEYLSDSKINETYTEEIQKIIDYNSCNHIFMNEKREMQLKRKIFNQLKLEEINSFAKTYFQYLFNIFKEDTNSKPHCVIVHVPKGALENSKKYNKETIKNLFYENIYTQEQVPNFSLNIQNTLLSDTYIWNHVTKNLNIARYVTPSSNPYPDIFHYIINSIGQNRKQKYNNNWLKNVDCLFEKKQIIDTVPNFNLFKKIYQLGFEKDLQYVQEKVEQKMNWITQKKRSDTTEVEESIENVFDKIESNGNFIEKEKELNNELKNVEWNLKRHVSQMNIKEVQNYELKNGIKINLYNTKIDKKNLYFRLIIPHNKILKKKNPDVFALLFSVLCLFEGGEIENVSRENVEIHCSNKNINIYIDVNDEFFYIDIYTFNKYENMNSAFSILNNIILQTKIEHTALQRVVDKLRRDFFDYKNNLQSFLIGQTISYLSDEAIGYQNFDFQMIEQISFDKIKEELNLLFSDTSLFELTIVGNFGDFIHYYILHYIGTLKKNTQEIRIKQKGLEEETRAKTETETRKKTGIKREINNEMNINTKIETKIETDFEKKLQSQYNMLCPVKNFEKKSKEITYVYLKEKEEHGIFLLVGKSANNYGFLNNGIHISFYLLSLLQKLYSPSQNIKNEKEAKTEADIEEGIEEDIEENIEEIKETEKEMEKEIKFETRTEEKTYEKSNDENMCGNEIPLWNNLKEIKNYVNLNIQDETEFEEFISKKKKLYTNPLFFSIASYIIQYILNSKLFHYLREKRELTYDSSFEFINYEKYFTGFFTLLVQTNPKDLDLIKKEVLYCFEKFTKHFQNFSDYLIENAKLSYLNKKHKDLKFFIDKIFGMQLTHFPLKYKNKYLLKDNHILNQIEKIDILLVVFVLFNQTTNYHISYGIAASDNLWSTHLKNINTFSE